MTFFQTHRFPLAFILLSGGLLASCGNTSSFTEGQVTQVKATRSADGKSGTVSAADALASSGAGSEVDVGAKSSKEGAAARELKAGTGSDLAPSKTQGADDLASKDPGQLMAKGGAKAGANSAAPNSAAPAQASEARKKALLAAANACASALKLPAESPFEHIRVEGKNKNSQTLVSDLGPRQVPALVEIDVKNANRALVSLKAPGASYCLAMDAKSANGIKIDIACDVRVFILAINYTVKGHFSLVKGREIRCAE